MSKGVWRAVETETRKTSVAKTKERREEGKRGKEISRKEKEKTKERKNNKSSKRIGDFG